MSTVVPQEIREGGEDWDEVLYPISYDSFCAQTQGGKECGGGARECLEESVLLLPFHPVHGDSGEYYQGRTVHL